MLPTSFLDLVTERGWSHKPIYLYVILNEALAGSVTSLVWKLAVAVLVRANIRLLIRIEWAVAHGTANLGRTVTGLPSVLAGVVCVWSQAR